MTATPTLPQKSRHDKNKTRTIEYAENQPARDHPLKATRYFEEQVLRKRPYIRPEWCAQVLAAPLRREPQPDGRIRLWGMIEALRVVAHAV
jgi:hypothetical protein